ncbi:MAG: DUF4838 domain-containing protein, partial [Planctomycetota bacterium]
MLRRLTIKISGAELPITSKPVKDSTRIYVGRSKYTDKLGLRVKGLKHGAYVMKSGKDYIALLGFDTTFKPIKPFLRNSGDLPRMRKEWDKVTGHKWNNPTNQVYKQYNSKMGIWQVEERGTLNAVYEFIRIQGVRWYMPGEMGEILPEKKSINIPSVNEVKKPHFALRQLYFGHFGIAPQDHILWYLRMGLNHVESVLGFGPIGHGSRGVHGRDEFKKANPECYLLAGGKRVNDKKGSGLPCLSSKKLLNENIDYARFVLDHFN